MPSGNPVAWVSLAKDANLMTLFKSLSLGALAALACGLPAAAATVTVTIKDVHSGTGFVLAQLCDKPQGYPVAGCKYQAAVPAEAGKVELQFHDVTPGVYALVAFHDEDGDFVPSVAFEGTAFGNDAPPPRPMADASFEVKDEARQTIHMTYRPQEGPK